MTFCDNCFIIRSPMFSYFNYFLTAQGSDLPFFSREHGSNYAWAEYYCKSIQTKNRYWYTYRHGGLMHINRQCRLRVVPLSPSPSSKTRKKTTRKNGRARSAIFFSRISFASRSRCLPVLPYGKFTPTSTHLVITYFKFIFLIPRKKDNIVHKMKQKMFISHSLIHWRWLMNSK